METCSDFQLWSLTGFSYEASLWNLIQHVPTSTGEFPACRVVRGVVGAFGILIHAGSYAVSRDSYATSN